MLNHVAPSVSASDVAFRETGSTERQQLIDALHSAAGSQSQAARILGINRVTVWTRMRKYGINLKREIKRHGSRGGVKPKKLKACKFDQAENGTTVTRPAPLKILLAGPLGRSKAGRSVGPGRPGRKARP